MTAAQQTEKKQETDRETRQQPLPGSRIHWCDTLKFLCILMVVYCHHDGADRKVMDLYSPFFLFAFFFVSGYLYREEPFPVFLYKKFRQLLVPWLAFSHFNIVTRSILSFHDHEGLLTELGKNLLQIREYGDEVWFVAALFAAYLPFYGIIRLQTGKQTLSAFSGQSLQQSGPQTENRIDLQKGLQLLLMAFLLSLASSLYHLRMPAIFPWGSNALPWHLDYLPQGIFIMLLGYDYRRLKIEESRTSWAAVLLSLLYCLIVLTWPAAWKRNPALNLTDQYATRLLGLCLIVTLAKQIRLPSVLNLLGENTIIIFGLHAKVIAVLQTLLQKAAPLTEAGSMTALVLTVLNLFLMLIPIQIINRYLPWLIGRKR